MTHLREPSPQPAGRLITCVRCVSPTASLLGAAAARLALIPSC
uniref:Uncharacterized protein n=1 Tax=Anguilla anguilla TaxID=7936 RepID=A0A0E9RTE9_ANGAN